MAKFSGFMILTSVSPWPAPPTIDMSTGRGAALPPKAVAAAVADEAVAAAVDRGGRPGCDVEECRLRYRVEVGYPPVVRLLEDRRVNPWPPFLDR